MKSPDPPSLEGRGLGDLAATARSPRRSGSCNWVPVKGFRVQSLGFKVKVTIIRNPYFFAIDPYYGNLN